MLACPLFFDQRIDRAISHQVIPLRHSTDPLSRAGEVSTALPQKSQEREPWLSQVVAPEAFYPPPPPPPPPPRPPRPPAAAPKTSSHQAQALRKPSKAEESMIQGQQVSISRAVSRRLCAKVATHHSGSLFASVRVENVTMLTARCAPSSSLVGSRSTVYEHPYCCLAAQASVSDVTCGKRRSRKRARGGGRRATSYT